MNKITIHQALLKGVEAHKAGRVQEADRYYTAILKSHPKHPDANHNMGSLAVSIGKVQEALPFFEIALESHPEKPHFWLSYINALIKLQRTKDAKQLLERAKTHGVIGSDFDKLEKKIDTLDFEKMNAQDPIKRELETLKDLYKQRKLEEVYKRAKILAQTCTDSVTLWSLLGASAAQIRFLDDAAFAFKKALELKADCFATYNNLGNVLKDQGRLNEAINAFSQALSIKPEFPEAYNNMGNTFRKQGKIEEAIFAYESAVSMKHDYAEAFNNLGISFQDQGKLDMAVQSYKKALSLKPDLASAAENAFGLISQISDIKCLDNEFVNLLELKVSEFSGEPKFIILSAIRAFLTENLMLVREHLNQYTLIDPQSISNLNRKDQIFCSVYSRFLSQLIEACAMKKKEGPQEKKVYHLGESHCLSFAHQNIQIGNVLYSVVPKITFGGKVFHFSRPDDNAYKAITKTNFDTVPNGSKVFISFGEIDCRYNEGFMLAAQKLNKPISVIMESAIHGYLVWLSKQNEIKQCKLYILNVPAPIIRDDIDHALNTEVARNIVEFNILMSENVQKFNYQLVDIYNFTARPDGFSNKEYHIDGYHLGPAALQEIENQISITY